jgi:hypothetical protein
LFLSAPLNPVAELQSTEEEEETFKLRRFCDYRRFLFLVKNKEKSCIYSRLWAEYIELLVKKTLERERERERERDAFKCATNFVASRYYLALSLSLCLSGPPLQEASCLITGFTSAERIETHKSKFSSSAAVGEQFKCKRRQRREWRGRERSRSHKVKEQEGNENSKFLKKNKKRN